MKTLKKLFGAEKLDTSILDMPRAQKRRLLHTKPVPANIAVAEVDHIPEEVAKSMLFTPGVKLTSRMRKNCMAARETVFVSTLEPKDYAKKLAADAARASAAQLVKWANRVVVKRAKCRRDYLKLQAAKAKLDPMKLHDIARANRMLAIIDIEAQRCDAEMASYRSEAERRLIKGDLFNPVRD
jgi:hypothetical protein